MRATPPVRMPSLGFHFLAAVDIEGFSRLAPAEQVDFQHDLRTALEEAATATDLDRGEWLTQASGDGELAVLPGGTDGLRLVTEYPGALEKALRGLNSRLRVRLALHHGPVAAGHLGPAGTAPIVVARLLDADPLRAELRDRPCENLVLIVSKAVYEDIVQSRFRGLDPADFHPVTHRTKGVTYTGYIRRPSSAARHLHALDDDLAS